MTQTRTDELEDLSLQYKEAYAIEAEAKMKKDEIKEQIKELVGSETFDGEFVKVSHLTKAVIDYSGMIADAGIKIPERYKSTRSETRLTIKKAKATDEH